MTVVTHPSSAGALVATLFDEHARMVLAICRMHLRDPRDAEDAAQQTFLNAHKALLTGTTPRESAAWLATIARNECRGRIGRRLRTPQLVPLDEVEAVLASAETVDQSFALSRLTESVAELPERQREAVVLKYVYGLSYEEVGAAMSVTTPAVTSLLARARRGLAGAMPALVQGALAVPVSLRESLARLIPELGDTHAPVAAAAVGGGVLAKLASAPLTAKVATATVAATVAVGGAAENARRAAPQPVHRGIEAQQALVAPAPARPERTFAPSVETKPASTPLRTPDTSAGERSGHGSRATTGSDSKRSRGSAATPTSDPSRDADPRPPTVPQTEPEAPAADPPTEGPSTEETGGSDSSGPGSGGSESSGSESSGSESSGSESSGSESSGSGSSGSGSSGSGSDGSGSGDSGSSDPE